MNSSQLGIPPLPSASDGDGEDHNGGAVGLGLEGLVEGERGEAAVRSSIPDMLGGVTGEETKYSLLLNSNNSNSTSNPGAAVAAAVAAVGGNGESPISDNSGYAFDFIANDMRLVGSTFDGTDGSLGLTLGHGPSGLPILEPLPVFESHHQPHQQMQHVGSINQHQQQQQQQQLMPQLHGRAGGAGGLVAPASGGRGGQQKQARKRKVVAQQQSASDVASDDGDSDNGWSELTPGNAATGSAKGEEPMPQWTVNEMESCCRIFDARMAELPPPSFHVQMDKGVKRSSRSEDVYICQKKNHFQVTLSVQLPADPAYIATASGMLRVNGLFAVMYGIKLEAPGQRILLEQSQPDRSKRAFKPVQLSTVVGEPCRMTVGRLHFSEPTANNMRKKGRPNPDQRFFALIVTIAARSGDQYFPIASHISDRLIVRASNPRQFEIDSTQQQQQQTARAPWIKGHTPNSVYHVGSVGVNVEAPDEALCVFGNIRLSGAIFQPSDGRLKEDIQLVDAKQQLNTIRNLGLYRYNMKQPHHPQTFVSPQSSVGVLAQEVQAHMPDAIAVSDTVVQLDDGTYVSDLLLVNKERIFMENIGATKELCNITDMLLHRIETLEKQNRMLFDIMMSRPPVSSS